MRHELIKPVIIIGAPRSGTSLLQKIFRNYPGFWSLPSESDIIWDQFCHPSLLNWDSECIDKSVLTPGIKQSINNRFNQFLCPSTFWSRFENTDLIWGFQRNRKLRKLLKPIYKLTFPLTQLFFTRSVTRRMVEKTASNCFRLDYVNAVFPDSRIIYITRDGRNNINSLINAWLHPKRFFTYNVPVNLKIKDYPFSKWKFVLPPGWKKFTNRPLEEVCAFQWISCHQHVQSSIKKPEYAGRVLQIKLESLRENPPVTIKQLADFCEIQYNNYLKNIAHKLPIVNSPDQDTRRDKWKSQNRQMIEHILPDIKPMMEVLGYNE